MFHSGEAFGDDEFFGFYRRVAEASLKTIPGVRHAAAGTAVPLAAGIWGKYFTVEDHPAARLADVPVIQYRQVTPDYFRALGVPLRSGRYFGEEDVSDRPLVAIINEAAARQFFPSQNPIGKRVWIQLCADGILLRAVDLNLRHAVDHRDPLRDKGLRVLVNS